MSYPSIELFAGAGGLAIGLKNSGFVPAAVVEFDDFACETLSANHLAEEGARVFSGDVRDFDYSPFVGKVELVSGGPPCQPFSLGGLAKGVQDDRDMFPEAVRAIREVQPRAFIFENVKGLLRKNFERYYSYIIFQLQYPSMVRETGENWESHRSRLEQHHTQTDHAGLEYRVVFRLVNAADYGVPQKRDRVFIVGFRSDIDANWSFPEPTHSKDALLWDQYVSGEYWKRNSLPDPPKSESAHTIAERLKKRYGLFPPVLNPWVTVRKALADLPDPKLGETSEFDNHEFKPGARSYPGHTGSYIDEPSKALKAGVHGVPGGENMLRREDETVRYFTVRESARIQTFPDDYIFHGSWGRIMRQLGNAVPATLAETVGRSVSNALERADRVSKDT